MKKSPAIICQVEVVCLGDLQNSAVLERTLRMCPFQFLLLAVVEIQASKNELVCATTCICLWNLVCHSEIEVQKENLNISLCCMKHYNSNI